MAGPLPTPNPRRRNAPTIPTTNLPVSGRSAPAPKVPSWVTLGRAGKAWWRWAWSIPQACAWSDGDVSTVARRAMLEDDLAALDEVEGLDLIEVAEASDLSSAKAIVRSIASLATGRLQMMKHMADLDDRLGLSPKAMAALRWKIVDDSEPEVVSKPDGSNVRRLRAVDPSAVAGA